MARLVGTSFIGVRPSDSDVDAPTWRRVLRAIAKDLALVYDRITGQNSATDTITHVGGGRGCPPAFPLVNQGVGRRVRSNDAGNRRAAVLLACPVMVPEGTTSLTVRVHGDVADEVSLRAELRDTSWDVSSASVVRMVRDGEQWHAILSVEAGLQFVVVRGDVEDGPLGTIHAWSVHAPHMRRGGGPQRIEGNDSNPFAITSRGSAPLAFVDIDEDMIADDRPISAWLLTQINRNATGLLEYLTGAPPPGNASLQQADSDDDDPTTSAFFAHTQAGFAAEPDVAFPLAAEALGAVESNGAPAIDSAHTAGLADAYAPIPTSTSESTGHRVRVRVPDLADPTDVTCTVLCANDPGKGTPTNWECRVVTGAGASARVALTQLGSSGFYSATITGIVVDADALETFELQMRNTSGVTTHGEISLVGYALYYDP